MIEYKWCDSCQLWRPPRASHCDICKCCFDRFDHHCPWVGTCVARSNHRFFIAFLLCISLGGLCVPTSLALALASLGGFQTRLEDWTAGLAALALLGGCGLCCFGSISFQAICQSGMLCLDLTTKDVAHQHAAHDCAELPLRCKAGCSICCAPMRARGFVVSDTHIDT
mmetsp:Transcript_4509/g.7576  ORF Transcript_4509/g.7576 Transcript_4509/m.7576 type:complete len:168 (+) Transcript_4509:108-611(+)